MENLNGKLLQSARNGDLDEVRRLLRLVRM